MTGVMEYWFGDVAHIIVVMTCSPRVDIANVGKSVPVSGCKSVVLFRPSSLIGDEHPSHIASRESTRLALESCW
jgi:hypothetical protein